MSVKNVPQVTPDWEHGEHVGGYSDYIDVRAPCEFEEDHIPGAINLPVLNDEERVAVGTLYKANPFEARRLGAGLVAKNLHRILDTHFADKGKDYHPLVYCWRGGQRSGSLSRVLAEIGYRTSVLQGGYKTYRNDVMENLKTDASKFTFNVVSGPTGSCKTRLLHRMHAKGLQVLDLEEIAQHRGSVLGELGEQPSQKWFESLIAARLRKFNPAKVVWVEAESNNIGKRCMPQGVMDQMQRGVRFHIHMPLHQRVKGLLEDYHHLGVDTDMLRGMMKKLARFHSKAQVAEWAEMIDRHDGAALVESLLLNHYDPTYQRSHQKLSSKHAPGRVNVEVSGVSGAELDAAIEFCLSAPLPEPSDAGVSEQSDDAEPDWKEGKSRAGSAQGRGE